MDTARRSGRTTRMVMNVAALDGIGKRSVVIVPNRGVQRVVEQMLREIKVRALVVSVDPDAQDDHRLRGVSAARHYDHTWYEQRAKVWRHPELWP